MKLLDWEIKRYYCLISVIVIFALLLTGCQVPDNAKNTDFDFDSVIITSPLDYSEQKNWAYYGIGEKEVDLFLICPTVFTGSEDVLNMPIDDTKSRERFVGALNMERGLYEDSCKMYAPFYSQAALVAYTSADGTAVECFDTAYADVKASFIYYMKNINHGRPFILAGFSQGSDMALRLMKEFWGYKTFSDINIAAYLIGWRVTEDDIKSYPFLKMAKDETDTGCIISFNTEAEHVQSSIIVPDKTLGINPLSWSTDSTPVTAEFNKGACFTDYDGEITKEIPNMTGAYLDAERGTLKVTDVNSEEYPVNVEIFGEGVYHVYDYMFFYRNLQENVAKRINSFFMKSNSQ